MIRRATRERAGRILSLAVTALFVNSIFPILPVQAALGTPSVHAEVGPILGIGDPRVTVTPATPSDPQPTSAPNPVAKRRLVVRASAYSSTVDQCDGNPFITASGTKVHDGTIAMNGIPFGTKIRIPSRFGNKIFTVEDRMSARWGSSRIDIWTTTRAQAMQWGVRTVTIEIL